MAHICAREAPQEEHFERSPLVATIWVVSLCPVFLAQDKTLLRFKASLGGGRGGLAPHDQEDLLAQRLKGTAQRNRPAPEFMSSGHETEVLSTL